MCMVCPLSVSNSAPKQQNQLEDDSKVANTQFHPFRLIDLVFSILVILFCVFHF